VSGYQQPLHPRPQMHGRTSRCRHAAAICSGALRHAGHSLTGGRGRPALLLATPATAGASATVTPAFTAR
jgi:hypothetical protein